MSYKVKLTDSTQSTLLVESASQLMQTDFQSSLHKLQFFHDSIRELIQLCSLMYLINDDFSSIKEDSFLLRKSSFNFVHHLQSLNDRDKVSVKHSLSLRSEIMLTVQHMWCSEDMTSEFSDDEAWEAWASKMSSYEAAFDLWRSFKLKLTSYEDCDDSWKEAMLKLKLFLYKDCSMSWEKAMMLFEKAAESCRVTKNFSAKKFFIQLCNDSSIWWLQESWCCILCMMFSEVILIWLIISDTMLRIWSLFNFSTLSKESSTSFTNVR